MDCDHSPSPRLQKIPLSLDGFFYESSSAMYMVKLWHKCSALVTNKSM